MHNRFINECKRHVDSDLYGYIMMEASQLNKNISYFLEHELSYKRFISILFTLLYTTHLMERSNVNHKDFSTRNILIQKNDVYTHIKYNIRHGDINHDIFLNLTDLDNYIIKITDFGLSNRYSRTCEERDILTIMSYLNRLHDALKISNDYNHISQEIKERLSDMMEELKDTKCSIDNLNEYIIRHVNILFSPLLVKPDSEQIIINNSYIRTKQFVMNVSGGSIQKYYINKELYYQIGLS